MRALQKIIWATNPLEENALKNRSMQVLRDLSKKTGATIEPVYVLSDGLLSVSLPKKDLVEQFKPISQIALQKMVDKGHLKRITKPMVLVSAPSSRADAVKALDRYARKQHADLILVNSHGRHGIKRALLGSFAETLTMYSKTPVVVAGPNTKHITKLDHILFPTDFSKESKRALEKVQQMAKKLHAKITIFHAVVNPIQPVVQSGAELLGGGFVWSQNSYERLYESHEKLVEAWAKLVRKKGIKVDTVVNMAGGGVIASVLQYAKKKKPGLIAMSSESGAISAALLGSIGRELAREAPCPVWYLRG